MANRLLRDLPEGYDPYDVNIKRRFHEKADELNYIHVSKKYPVLACGARSKNKKTGDRCALSAGFGTDHVGYGRCKFHGGSSTGPKTPEGKANVGRSVVHGLYSKALLPHERQYFDDFAGQEVGLEYEIAVMKTKILSYLKKTADKWEKAYEEKLARVNDHDRAMDHADKETRVWYTTINDDGDGGKIESIGSHYYHAGTIEDKPLIRALETLGRLVDKHAKLKGLDRTDAENILDGINRELRAASHGQVTMSWGGPAQTRTTQTEE